jgi:hypothetical protein
MFDIILGEAQLFRASRKCACPEMLNPEGGARRVD